MGNEDVTHAILPIPRFQLPKAAFPIPDGNAAAGIRTCLKAAPPARP